MHLHETHSIRLSLNDRNDDGTINEWSVESAIQVELALRDKNREGRRYIWEIRVVCGGIHTMTSHKEKLDLKQPQF